MAMRYREKEGLDKPKPGEAPLVLCSFGDASVTEGEVAEAFQKYASGIKGFHVLPIYGGQSYERQFRALAAGAQIVIGTPGRVLDHLETKDQPPANRVPAARPPAPTPRPPVRSF